MSTDNALVTLLREGVSVQESAVDSKRDLEDALRSACNDFIEHTSQSLARDLFNLDEQCKVTGAAMVESAFMNGETVKLVFEKTLHSLETQVSDVVDQMGLYLDNSVTQSILLKPVSRKIIRAVEDARKNLEKVAEGQNGWDTNTRIEVLGLMEQVDAAVKSAVKSTK